MQYFLDDLGNFEKLSKSGPVDLLTITKIVQRIQENMGTSWDILLLWIWEPKTLDVFDFFESHVYHFFEVWSTLFWIIVSEDEDLEMMTLALINREKLGYEFHIYKKTWNRNLVNPKYLFIYFQGRSNINLADSKGFQGHHLALNSRK